MSLKQVCLPWFLMKMFLRQKLRLGLQIIIMIMDSKLRVVERISIERHKTKAKPITYQLDYSANLKQ